MNSLEIGIRIAAGVGLILVNAFFVSIEFALTRLRQFDKSDIEQSPTLLRAWEMTRHLELHLTGCQVGISLTSILFGIVAEPAVTEVLHPLFSLVGLPETQTSYVSVVVSVVLINLIHSVWGEQAPTYLGVEKPLEIAEWFTAPLYWWTKVMYPFIYFGDILAKWTLGLINVEITRSWTDAETDTEPSISSYADLRTEMGELLASGEISSERRQEVLRALESGRETVTDIMVERDAMVTLSTANSAEENIQILRETDHVRYPVVGDSPEEFVGILYLPRTLDHLDTLCDGELDVEDLAAPPLTVPDATSIAEVVDIFQEQRQELALVADNGRVVGLVTSTDAFEYILGDLEDPTD